jgi:hypothetical protein
VIQENVCTNACTHDLPKKYEKNYDSIEPSASAWFEVKRGACKRDLLQLAEHVKPNASNSYSSNMNSSSSKLNGLGCGIADGPEKSCSPRWEYIRNAPNDWTTEYTSCTEQSEKSNLQTMVAKSASIGLLAEKKDRSRGIVVGSATEEKREGNPEVRKTRDACKIDEGSLRKHRLCDNETKHAPYYATVGKIGVSGGVVWEHARERHSHRELYAKREVICVPPIGELREHTG